MAATLMADPSVWTMPSPVTTTAAAVASVAVVVAVAASVDVAVAAVVAVVVSVVAVVAAAVAVVALVETAVVVVSRARRSPSKGDMTAAQRGIITRALTQYHPRACGLFGF